MKIYFVGSTSVGKSTLARYVSKVYNLDFLPEAARMVLSERELNLDDLRSNIDLVDDYQQSVFLRQLAEEDNFKSFVSDRSFDCLGYSAQFSRVFGKTLKSNEFIQYINKLKADKAIIFFVRPSKATLKQDGVRETISWDNIIAVDAVIKSLLEMFELRYFQINTDNMQERIRFVDAVLSLAF